MFGKDQSPAVEAWQAEAHPSRGGTHHQSLWKDIFQDTPGSGVSRGSTHRTIKPAEPTIPCSAEEPSWQEVNNFLKKAPGPNGIPYKVYKYC